MGAFVRRGYLNFIASWVVLVVGVPLAVGTSLVSGAPLTAGLLATGLGGAVVALLGGVPLLICGPSVAMAVLVAPVLEGDGVVALQQAGVIAGALQLLLAWL